MSHNVLHEIVFEIVIIDYYSYMTADFELSFLIACSSIAVV